MTALIAPRAAVPDTPVDLLLFCPMCGTQHIDEPDGGWLNPPHRSHLCHGCGCVWRPADVPTNGVARINTAGQADSWGDYSNWATPPRHAVEALADKLVDQHDEPFPGSDSARLHYWRDKAIAVANALRDLSASTSMPAMATSEVMAVKAATRDSIADYFERVAAKNQRIVDRGVGQVALARRDAALFLEAAAAVRNEFDVEVME